MNRLVAIIFALIVSTLSVAAQSTNPRVKFRDYFFFPSSDFRVCADLHWIIIVNTYPDGSLLNLTGTRKPIMPPETSGDRDWQNPSPQVEIVAKNPSDKSDYYHQGTKGAHWWVRADVDASGGL